MTLTISNVVSALYRGPGISKADTPALYEACYRLRKEVDVHLAIEGMRLVAAPHLGLFSAICKSRDEIEEAALRDKTEPFAPVFNAAPLRYHDSVMAVVLRKQRMGIEGNLSEWPDLDEIIHEFTTFLPPEEQGEEIRVQAAAKKSLEALVNLKLAEVGVAPGGKEAYRATGWLIMRLTQDEIARFTDVLLTHKDEDEIAGMAEEEEGVDDV